LKDSSWTWRSSGRPIFLTLGLPILLGVVYPAVTSSSVRYNAWDLAEQGFVLVIWLCSVLTMWYLVRWMVGKAGGRRPGRAATILLALLQCLLLMIHVGGIVGVLSWGEPPTADIVARFLPDLFNLADALSLPRALMAAILLFPPLLFLVLGWRSEGEMDRFLWERIHPHRSGRYIPYACAVLATAGILLILSRDPVLENFGNFRKDPVVSFAVGRKFLLPMTPRRSLWVKKDVLARGKLERRSPRIRNVILIIVDSLRADHLSIYGYSRPVDPFLSGMLKRGRGRRIPWALSNGCESRGGILAILTSKDIPSMSQYSYTLPEFFRDNGFKVWMILSGDHHWYHLREAYGRGIDRIVDGVDAPGPRGISDDALLLRETDRLPKDDGSFHFIVYHLMSVHAVGVIQEKYLRYQPVSSIPIFAWKDASRLGKGDAEAIVNLYDNRILQMDDVIGSLFRSLGEKGYLDDYVAVLTADHGELLGESGLYSHSSAHMNAAALRIPVLFLASSPLRPFPSGSFATQIDIGPTLADLTGLQIPSSWQGRSLLAEDGIRWNSHVNTNDTPGNHMALSYYRPGVLLKYSRFWGDPGLPRGERLTDLMADPGDTTDLLPTGTVDPGLLGEMRRRSGELMRP